MKAYNRSDFKPIYLWESWYEGSNWSGRGVVLVNASEETVHFDLGKLLPGLKSPGLWRIKADPAAYDSSPEAQAMLAYNDGRKENAARVEVSRLDALFLTKTKP